MADISKLRFMKYPPAVVIKVLSAVMILLHEDTSPEHIHKVLSATGFLTRMTAFEVHNVRLKDTVVLRNGSGTIVDRAGGWFAIRRADSGCGYAGCTGLLLS